MKVVWSYIKTRKDGTGLPLSDRETKDWVDVEAPSNRRERRAVAAWKRKQAKQGDQEAGR